MKIKIAQYSLLPKAKKYTIYFREKLRLEKNLNFVAIFYR